MRILLHTLGMFALGASCLLATGVAFQRRAAMTLSVSPAGSPVPTAGRRTAPRPARTATMSAALSGLSMTLTRASDALTADRGNAARLLDGAWGLSQVIGYVAAGDETHDLPRQVERALRALQDGHRGEAARLARVAARQADEAAPATLPPVPATPATFRGAVVLDAVGNRIGTLADIDRARVVIEGPSLRQLLGLVTLSHGARRAISRDAVLLGEPRRIGDTLIIAAVPAQDPGL